MDIVTWLVVGLVAGVLAGLLVGGYGVLVDMVIGMVGALVGGSLFAHEGWHAPISGLGGTIFIAFIGAVILLVILRLLRSATGGAPLSRR
ncbi:MAG: GlsB/YeaQ/YmgE family stress response membrane protein [Kofleriaceae bacterium]